MRHLKNWILSLVISSSGLLLFTGCVTEPNAITGEMGQYGYTWQQELALGASADRQMVSEMGVYQDDQLVKYVEGIGEKVLAESDMRDPSTPELYRNTEFVFRVVDSPIVNAFALPGGYVYVTRGLLAHVQNEAQLAVVLGHEITHVAARHASQQALKQQWGQIGLLAGAVVTEQVLERPQAAKQLLDVGGSLFQLLTLKYGRDAERESDLHGVEYAARAGYKTDEAANFFTSLKRISESQGASIPSWMSSHPDPGERHLSMIELARSNNPSANYVGEEAFLQRIDGLPIGNNPRQGFSRNGVFYHPEMRFRFAIPSGWRIKNETAAVYLAEPNNQAAMIFSIAEGNTAEEAARAFVRKQNIQAQGIPVRLNSRHPNYSIESRLGTANGTLELFMSFIEYNGSVYQFIGYAKPANYATYRVSFHGVAASLDHLDDKAILDVQPTRLKVVKADQDAPFRDFLPKKLPAGLSPLDVAIMNQLDLNTPIKKGALLKLPD